MAEFSVEYINPFLMAATSVIKDICQVDMKIGRPYVKTTEFASDSVIIMIGVTGEVRGQVLMSFPEAHALHVVSKMMMGMPVTALDDMSASAINELGNMMMGNAATILSTKGIANNFYGTGSYYLRRVHPGRVEKDICTYCGQRPGFDYEVIKRKQEAEK